MSQNGQSDEMYNRLLQVHQIVMDAHTGKTQLDQSHIAPMLLVVIANLITVINNVNTKIPANNVQPNIADIKLSVADILKPMAASLDLAMSGQANEIKVLKEQVESINDSMEKFLEYIQMSSTPTQG